MNAKKCDVSKIEILDENGNDISVYTESNGAPGKLSIAHRGVYYSTLLDYSGFEKIESFILACDNRFLADSLTPLNSHSFADIKETLKCLLSWAIDEIYDKPANMLWVDLFWDQIKKYPRATDSQKYFNMWIKGFDDLAEEKGSNYRIPPACIQYTCSPSVHALERFVLPAIKKAFQREISKTEKLKQARRVEKIKQEAAKMEAEQSYVGGDNDLKADYIKFRGCPMDPGSVNTIIEAIYQIWEGNLAPFNRICAQMPEVTAAGVVSLLTDELSSRTLNEMKHRLDTHNVGLETKICTVIREEEAKAKAKKAELRSKGGNE